LPQSRWSYRESGRLILDRDKSQKASRPRSAASGDWLRRPRWSGISPTYSRIDAGLQSWACAGADTKDATLWWFLGACQVIWFQVFSSHLVSSHRSQVIRSQGLDIESRGKGRRGLKNTLMAVFVVHHEYQRYDDRDETKIVGVYSTEAKAKLAIERLRALPRFSEYPDGFSVDCYPIDADHWIEGLVQQ
jgi:hypothetical protein